MCVARVSGPSAVHRDVKASYQVTYRALRLRKPGGGRRLCERQHIDSSAASASESVLVLESSSGRPQSLSLSHFSSSAGHRSLMWSTPNDWSITRTPAHAEFVFRPCVFNKFSHCWQNRTFTPSGCNSILPQGLRARLNQLWHAAYAEPRTLGRALLQAHLAEKRARRAAEPGI